MLGFGYGTIPKARNREPLHLFGCGRMPALGKKEVTIRTVIDTGCAQRSCRKCTNLLLSPPKQRTPPSFRSSWSFLNNLPKKWWPHPPPQGPKRTHSSKRQANSILFHSIVNWFHEVKESASLPNRVGSFELPLAPSCIKRGNALYPSFETDLYPQ